MNERLINRSSGLTASSDQRRQPHEHRRAEILEAAVGLFCEKGYEATTIRDIARAVGVTEGLLYHYFPSKSALIEACWRERSWLPRALAILQKSGDRPLREVLHDLILDHLAALRDNASGFRMHAAEMLRDSELAAISQRYISDTNAAVANHLIQQQAAGRVRTDVDPHVVAHVIIGTDTTFFVIHGRASDAEWQSMTEHLADEFSRLLERSLTADGPTHPTDHSGSHSKEIQPC